MNLLGTGQNNKIATERKTQLSYSKHEEYEDEEYEDYKSS